MLIKDIDKRDYISISKNEVIPASSYFNKMNKEKQTLNK